MVASHRRIFILSNHTVCMWQSYLPAYKRLIILEYPLSEHAVLQDWISLLVNAGWHLWKDLQFSCSMFLLWCLRASQRVMQTFLHLKTCEKPLKAPGLSGPCTYGVRGQTVSCMWGSVVESAHFDIKFHASSKDCATEGSFLGIMLHLVHNRFLSSHREWPQAILHQEKWLGRGQWWQKWGSCGSLHPLSCLYYIELQQFLSV